MRAGGALGRGRALSSGDWKSVGWRTQEIFMENTRQEKIAKQIQRDVAEIFQRDIAESLRGVLTTVTAVRVSPDLGYAKIYVSVFPFEKAQDKKEKIEQELAGETNPAKIVELIKMRDKLGRRS